MDIVKMVGVSAGITILWIAVWLAVQWWCRKNDWQFLDERD